MNKSENTKMEIALKRLLGEKGSNMLRKIIRAVSRGFSYFPFQSVRVFGLNILGAKIGKDIVLQRGVDTFSPWRLKIGSHSQIGKNVHLDARGDLKIGNNVNISDEVAIWTSEHDIQDPEFKMTRGPVVIDDYVWLCFRSIIMPGIKIGKGSVVASGSVVTHDVPPYTVVAGVPARKIKDREKNLRYSCGSLTRKDDK